jgi:transposase
MILLRSKKSPEIELLKIDTEGNELAVLRGGTNALAQGRIRAIHKGWARINVDAMPGSMQAFKKVRPRDINLEFGVGTKEGERDYYLFNEPALNGFSKELSEVRHVAETPYKIVEVVKRGGAGDLDRLLSAWLHRRHQGANERSEAMKRSRRNHGATFKAQVARAAVKGDKTLAELAEQFSVHPTQITEWKQQLLARAADVFGGAKPLYEMRDLKTLHAKIEQLALENDLLEGARTKAGLRSAKP